MKDVWKKFEQTELTHSSVHHLVAVNDQFKKNGYVRAVDIANFLNISRASVSITLNKLKEKGFIREDSHRFLQLTKKGKEIVNSVLSKRRIIERFFLQVLELSPEEAEVNACKTEHLLSETAGKKLLSFLGYYLSDAKPATEFRDALHNFSFLCAENESCTVCEEQCYFKGQDVHV
jgi:DtxR family Mn-dependent transcriptional regulator